MRPSIRLNVSVVVSLRKNREERQMTGDGCFNDDRTVRTWRGCIIGCRMDLTSHSRKWEKKTKTRHLAVKWLGDCTIGKERDLTKKVGDRGRLKGHYNAPRTILNSSGKFATCCEEFSIFLSGRKWTSSLRRKTLDEWHYSCDFYDLQHPHFLTLLYRTILQLEEKLL